MAELTLRRRPTYTVSRPTRGRAGIPRIPAPTLAGEAEIGALVRQQTKDAQDARWEQAQLSVTKLAEKNPTGAAQFWLDFLRRELRNHSDLYPKDSADRASLEAEVVLAERAVSETQASVRLSRMEAELAAGGLTDEESIRLLEAQLATLSPGTEEYYDTLARLREFRQAAAERGAKAGERASEKAWQERKTQLYNQIGDVWVAYQEGRIDGAQFDKKYLAIVGELIKEGRERGEKVENLITETKLPGMGNFYEIQRRTEMDPTMVLDVYDIDPDSGDYMRVRTTRHRLAEQNAGVVELLDQDPKTGKVTPFAFIVRTEGSIEIGEGEDKKKIPRVYFIDPQTGRRTTTIRGAGGKEFELAEIYGEEGPAGRVLKARATFGPRDPKTGKTAAIGSLYHEVGAVAGEGGARDVTFYRHEGGELKTVRTQATYKPETGEISVGGKGLYYTAKGEVISTAEAREKGYIKGPEGAKPPVSPALTKMAETAKRLPVIGTAVRAGERLGQIVTGIRETGLPTVATPPPAPAPYAAGLRRAEAGLSPAERQALQTPGGLQAYRKTTAYKRAQVASAAKKKRAAELAKKIVQRKREASLAKRIAAAKKIKLKEPKVQKPTLQQKAKQLYIKTGLRPGQLR